MPVGRLDARHRGVEGGAGPITLTPQDRRAAVAAMRERTPISIRRACWLAGVSRTVLAYEPRPNAANEALTTRMVELAHERRRFGYRRIHVLLRREGVHANHKRVQRLYRLAGLTVRRRRRRDRVAIERKPRLHALVLLVHGL